MPLQATSGAASYDGFGGGVPFVPTYIEEVFSTYLYTGNGSTQTITNGIDLSTKGGLVWIKGRSVAYSHAVFDTARGATNRLVTNATDANSVETGTLTAFNSTGFALGSTGAVNNNGTTFASWTFRKQPKFFDVQTATTNGSSSYGSTVPSMTITHSLGSVPGCVMVKRTDGTGGWYVWHRSLPALSGLAQTATYAQLNTTGAAAIFGGNVNGTGGWIQVTATNIYLDAWFNTYEPGTFVVYIFAHDAGGFGLTGTDNVISCGSFTGAATVTLGYEPQWVLYKRSDDASDWVITDTMRGMYASYAGANGPVLEPNTSDAEAAGARAPFVNATGFYFDGVNNGPGSTSGTYIYIAIRRGPMKTPTTGTSVFNAVTYTGNQTARNITGYGFPLDLVLGGRRNDTNNFKDYWFDRLRGATKAIDTNVSGGTAAEYTDAQVQTSFALQDGTSVGTDSTWNATGINIVLWGLRRAPGFFDVVCVTGGSGTVNTATHNLGVVPELVIQKYRGLADDWYVFTNQVTGFLNLNSTSARIGTTNYMTTTTSTVVNTSLVSNPANNPVIYLFATVAGVSKVGSYTGTGTTKQIDCGFTGGARFVLIKRTDSTGDWYVWDSARGIVAGNDPYLLLNSTAAEVTNTDYVDTYSAGFEISSTAPAAINANGGSFVFLAIA